MLKINAAYSSALTAVVAGVLLSFAAGSVALAEASGNSVHAGGLACFSMKPATPDTSQPPPVAQTCDQLCAGKNAACTATMSNRNPPVSCADEIDDPPSTLCRCCTVAR